MLLQKHQLSPEISEHQLGAALPVQHPGGYTIFFDFFFFLRLIGILNAEGSLSPARICFSYAQLLENDQIVSVQTRHFIVQYE